MFEYKPDRSHGNLGYDEIGTIDSDFEAFKPNPKYSWKKGERIMPSKDIWKIVHAKTAPPIGKLPQIIENVLKQTWKFAEPKAGAQRGNFMMGTHRGNVPNSFQKQTYHPQVRPVAQHMEVTFGSTAEIATDWKLFDQIERTNAVTFRGDLRSPREILQQYGGFNPPNTRTDRFYLENAIYDKFSDYLERRYQRPLSKEDFLRAVDSTIPNDADKKILVDYMMWRKICEGESMHLGRMLTQECLKGYISTSRAIDSAVGFGTRHLRQIGWVYLTIVHAGFIVPWGKTAYWGSEEAEIAQWGPIPAERIVGFARFDPDGNRGTNPRGLLDSDIYIRRSFRKREPEAFEKMFKIFSGKTP